MALMTGNLLTENHQSIETSLGSWADVATMSSAVVQSSEQASDGTFSIKATRNATAPPGPMASITTTANAPTVVATTVYKFTFWVYTSIAGAVFAPYVDFYQSDNTTFISGGQGTAVTVTQNSWTRVGGLDTFTAPALAGKARIYLRTVSGLASGDVAYFDEIFFGVPAAPVARVCGTAW